MTQPGQDPDAPRQPPVPAAAPGQATVARFRRAAIALLATAAVSALLGLLAGLLWSALAPRALLIVQSRGVAYVANAETSAFIVADAWFCLLTAVGGLVCGVAGYFAAVRRHGAAALIGLVGGGLAASFLAMWVGQQQGQAHFQSVLAASRAGALLHEPLALGGRGTLAFWPLLVALAVGTFELTSQSAERKRAETGGQAALAGPDGDEPGPAGA